MQTQTHYTLKSQLLAQTIESQGLKRWWVAERSGIHKTTLRRWLNGRSTRIRKDNAERMAQLLAIPVSGFAE